MVAITKVARSRPRQPLLLFRSGCGFWLPAAAGGGLAVLGWRLGALMVEGRAEVSSADEGWAFSSFVSGGGPECFSSDS